MSPNLKRNHCGFATICRKLYFSFVGCCKPKKVGNHWIRWVTKFMKTSFTQVTVVAAFMKTKHSSIGVNTLLQAYFTNSCRGSWRSSTRTINLWCSLAPPSVAYQLESVCKKIKVVRPIIANSLLSRQLTQTMLALEQRLLATSMVVNRPRFEARARPEPDIFLKPELGSKAKLTDWIKICTTAGYQKT